VRIVTDISGNVLDVISYDAFGNITSETNPSAGGRLKFQGGEYDGATGSYYFGARYYDPEAMRWETEDPLGLAAGPNLYTFANNDPANLVDPTGTLVFIDPQRASYMKVRNPRIIRGGVSIHNGTYFDDEAYKRDIERIVATLKAVLRDSKIPVTSIETMTLKNSPFLWLKVDAATAEAVNNGLTRIPREWQLICSTLGKNEPSSLLRIIGCDIYGTLYEPSKTIRAELAPIFGRRAGADIKADLEEHLEALDAAYKALSREQKEELAARLYTPPANLIAWDFRALIDDGPQNFGITKDLEIPDTATVNGRVYYTYQINYILWGRINRLLSDDGIRILYGHEPHPKITLDLTLSTVRFYRNVKSTVIDAQGSEGQLAWTKVGWTGNWDEAISSAIPNAVPNKRVYNGGLGLNLGAPPISILEALFTGEGSSGIISIDGPRPRLPFRGNFTKPPQQPVFQVDYAKVLSQLLLASPQFQALRAFFRLGPVPAITGQVSASPSQPGPVFRYKTQ